MKFFKREEKRERENNNKGNTITYKKKSICSQGYFNIIFASLY